jgi:hypothetical protein
MRKARTGTIGEELIHSVPDEVVRRGVPTCSSSSYTYKESYKAATYFPATSQLTKNGMKISRWHYSRCLARTDTAGRCCSCDPAKAEE